MRWKICGGLLNQNAPVKHRKKVHNRSGQNKAVPNSMGVFATLPDIKSDTQGVKQATQN